MKLNVGGDIFSQVGYSTHTRFLADALLKAGHDVGIECDRPEGWEFGCPDSLFKMLTKDNSVETSIMITQPPYFTFKWGDGAKNVIGFVIWEGDRVPKYWWPHLKRCAQLWVPSTHVKEALLKTFEAQDLPPIFVVPHGVDHKYFYPKPELKNKEFTFVCVKGWRGGMEDRGGVQYLLKAFVEEFSEDEPVKLLLKLNSGYLPQGWNLDEELKKIGIDKLPKNVEIITGNVAFKELVDIYNKGHVFVCPTRAEGFNFPGLEAMACGLPTIQTNFGGQTDYMKEENSFNIRYDLEEVKGNLLYEGIKWAIPDVKHLKLTMRRAFENKELIGKRGLISLKDSKNWTWDHSAAKAGQALGLLNKETSFEGVKIKK